MASKIWKVVIFPFNEKLVFYQKQNEKVIILAMGASPFIVKSPTCLFLYAIDQIFSNPTYGSDLNKYTHLQPIRVTLDG